MDARMDRVTGFQHLQKADSQAPVPGVPPTSRGYTWQRLCWGDQLLAKCPEDGPQAGLGTAGPRPMGTPEAAQHMGQVYSHLPHTEPSYPKQNGKEQKQRVSESTAQAGAGPPSPGGRGRGVDGQTDTRDSPPGRRPATCVCLEG